jgi:WD40 repeat protein
MWNSTSGQLLMSLNLKDAVNSWSIHGLVFLSNDNIVFFCDEIILVWDETNRRLLKSLKGHEGKVQAITLLSSDDMLVSGSLDKTIRVWNLTTGCQKLSWP